MYAAAGSVTELPGNMLLLLLGSAEPDGPEL